MPELPEVETVKEVLKKEVLNKTIKDVIIRYDKILENIEPKSFIEKIKNQTIIDIKRKGKWLLFELTDYYLLSHLRMEGKYYIKNSDDEITKHQHVIFIFEDGKQLRYNDTRKFGKMYLLDKDNIYNKKPLIDVGKEPWELDVDYLKDNFKNKKLPIKTVLLDQTIIAGLGNIYCNEVLFRSKINPYKKAFELNDKELESIIINSKITLEKAIKLGGTTIKSYTSSEGVHGRFQNELLVHMKTVCPECGSALLKEKIGGRTTYYCKDCQNK